MMVEKYEPIQHCLSIGASCHHKKKMKKTKKSSLFSSRNDTPTSQPKDQYVLGTGSTISKEPITPVRKRSGNMEISRPTSFKLIQSFATTQNSPITISSSKDMFPGENPGSNTSSSSSLTSDTASSNGDVPPSIQVNKVHQPATPLKGPPIGALSPNSFNIAVVPSLTSVLLQSGDRMHQNSKFNALASSPPTKSPIRSPQREEIMSSENLKQIDEDFEAVLKSRAVRQYGMLYR